jgi:peptidoglycan/LPS O-acetylase OafA/YrhL
MSNGRIPSLDGLRALSIIAVVLGHLSGTQGAPAWLGTVNLAHLGVSVFFIISGFLITGLLITEEERRGRISLPHFYLRRTLRIMPAYYVFLLAMVIAVLFGPLQIGAIDFAHAATYTINYGGHRSWEIGHFWSLAVEEQFYLLWPLTFLLAGRKRAAYIALGAVCVIPVLRLAEFTYESQFPWDVVHGANEWIIGVTFETAADGIALGCLMALWRPQLDAHPVVRRVTEYWWLPLVLMGVSVLFGHRWKSRYLLTDTFANLAIGTMLLRVLRDDSRPLARMLNARPLAYIGTLSYSIYLWQQPFLYAVPWQKARHVPIGGWWRAFPQNLVLTAACAVGSYYLVEKPFLRLRPRVERWWDSRPSVRRRLSASEL